MEKHLTWKTNIFSAPLRWSSAGPTQNQRLTGGGRVDGPARINAKKHFHGKRHISPRVYEIYDRLEGTYKCTTSASQSFVLPTSHNTRTHGRSFRRKHHRHQYCHTPSQAALEGSPGSFWLQQSRVTTRCVNCLKCLKSVFKTDKTVNFPSMRVRQMQKVTILQKSGVFSVF